ncbi:MAG: DUF1850 domain-containing protein [Chloroflexota bacterium]|nr:DUF1850 domain-containing protein [Chloroflexota bacterium]
MRHRSAVAGLVLATVVMLGAALSPVRMIAVTTAEEGALVCHPIGRDSTVTLVFTHSMYGGDVRETYVAAPSDRLLRTSIVTANAAAAEYYATDGRIFRIAKGYRLLVPEQTFDHLVFRIDDIGKHRLLIDGDTIALTDESGQSRQARLDVAPSTIGGALLGRLGSGSPC